MSMYAFAKPPAILFLPILIQQVRPPKTVPATAAKTVMMRVVFFRMIMQKEMYVENVTRRETLAHSA